MTTKQWLEQGEHIMREIKTLEAEKDAAALHVAKITHDIQDKIAKTSRTRNDAALVKYADSEYIARIDKRLKELQAILNEITQAIHSVENGKQRFILINRYLLPTPKYWKEISIDMGISESYVYELHAKALKSVEKHSNS